MKEEREVGEREGEGGGGEREIRGEGERERRREGERATERQRQRERERKGARERERQRDRKGERGGENRAHLEQPIEHGICRFHQKVGNKRSKHGRSLLCHGVDAGQHHVLDLSSIAQNAHQRLANLLGGRQPLRTAIIMQRANPQHHPRIATLQERQRGPQGEPVVRVEVPFGLPVRASEHRTQLGLVGFHLHILFVRLVFFVRIKRLLHHPPLDRTPDVALYGGRRALLGLQPGGRGHPRGRVGELVPYVSSEHLQCDYLRPLIHVSQQVTQLTVTAVEDVVAGRTHFVECCHGAANSRVGTNRSRT